MNMHDLFTSWTMRLQIKWVSDVTNIMKYPISCDRVFKNIFCYMKNVLFIITQIEKNETFTLRQNTSFSILFTLNQYYFYPQVPPS